MASRLWGYWGSPAPPQFPEPPRNPLAYCPHDAESAAPSALVTSSSPHTDQVVAQPKAVQTDVISENLESSAERDEMEEITFSVEPVEAAREENSEYRLLVRRYIAKELVPAAIQRWRESLTWLPVDVPAKLELGPIVAQFVPYYVFSALIESNCTGEYDVHTGTGHKEAAKTEIVVKEQLNEILVCASTDVHPTLLEELFQAKAFHPPATSAPKGGSAETATSPVIPRHPFHAIHYRNHLFSHQLVSEAVILQADVPVDMSNQMISDYLVHSAGPFLAEQAFRLQFGADSRNIHSSTSIRQLIRHLLLLPIYHTSFVYHDKPYHILVSGINAHVAGQRMTWGTGQLGRALSSVSTGISKIVSNNM